MSDGNYNNLKRAERALGDIQRRLMRAIERGENTDDLERDNVALMQRVDRYRIST